MARHKPLFCSKNSPEASGRRNDRNPLCSTSSLSTRSRTTPRGRKFLTAQPTFGGRLASGLIRFSSIRTTPAGLFISPSGHPLTMPSVFSSRPSSSESEQRRASSLPNLSTWNNSKRAFYELPAPATPNHALQRTAPYVTAPASTAAFPPTMQVPRRTPRSLSLGSLGGT